VQLQLPWTRAQLDNNIKIRVTWWWSAADPALHD
jgi:hypothetical protein